MTSSQFPTIDEFITSSNPDACEPAKKLKDKTELVDWSHIKSLSVQGVLFTSLSASLSVSSIKKWSGHIATMTSTIFKFVLKAIQQQLPTAANLKRWGKQFDPSCPLCKHIQTNKHVLSNCSSAVVLERYLSRYDQVLEILAEWITSVYSNQVSRYMLT